MELSSQFVASVGNIVWGRWEMHTKLSFKQIEENRQIGSSSCGWSRDSSVGIATGCGLNDRGLEFEFP
jgi:hypothetical protein